MATQNATTTDARYDAMNDAERALRELHALGDLLSHVDSSGLADETAASVGEMLDAIGQRVQASLNVLYPQERGA